MVTSEHDSDWRSIWAFIRTLALGLAIAGSYFGVRASIAENAAAMSLRLERIEYRIDHEFVRHDDLRDLVPGRKTHPDER